MAEENTVPAADAASEPATYDPAHDQISRLKADVVITRHVAVAAGAGIIPIPGVDAAGILAAQVSMLYYLCDIWGAPFTKEAARSVVLSLVGTSVSAGASRSMAVSSGLKSIPLAGSIAGMLLTPALAGASTYAIGRVFVEHLASGGTLLTFSAQKMKKHFEDALARAKSVMPGRKQTAHASA